MKIKMAPIIFGVLAVIVGFYLLGSYGQGESDYKAKDNNTQSVNTTNTQSAKNTSTNQGSDKVSSSLPQYTLAEVATHNNESDCWTTINGLVYDETSWIPRHPGGRQAILVTCGKDASDMFNAQHGGQSRPAAELKNLEIGVLKK